MNELTDGDVIGKPRAWRRSRYCANGACVEVAFDDGNTLGPQVFIRDGKLGAASRVIPLSRGAFRDLVDALKRDELELPA